MLQTFSWRIDPGDRSREEIASVMRDLASMLVRIEPKLRGLRVTETDERGRMVLQLRVAGHTRWGIQADARKLVTRFLRRSALRADQVTLELVTTERNGRELYLGEGRTPMTKRPRASRGEDEALWREYEWWGEDLGSTAE